MTSHTVAPVLLVLFTAAFSAISAEEPKNAPPLTIGIVADKERYKSEDNILLAVKFKQRVKCKIQISHLGNGALHYYLILQSQERKDKNGIGHVFIREAWELQFVKKPFSTQDPESQLIEVKAGFTQQLAIHLPHIAGLEDGKYALRIGYALHGKTLEPLIKAATGQEVPVGSIGDKVLDGAFDEPLLSDPITITIGPEKK